MVRLVPFGGWQCMPLGGWQCMPLGGWQCMPLGAWQCMPLGAWHHCMGRCDLTPHMPFFHASLARQKPTRARRGHSHATSVHRNVGDGDQHVLPTACGHERVPRDATHTPWRLRASRSAQHLHRATRGSSQTRAGSRCVWDQGL
jgi:hypothetical protein